MSPSVWSLALGALLAAGLGLIFMKPTDLGADKKSRPQKLGGLAWRTRDRLMAVGLVRIGLWGFWFAGFLIGLFLALLLLAVTGIYILSLLAFGVGLGLPVFWLGWRWRRLQSVNKNLWPDLVDSLISAIRAGASLPEALCSLAEHSPGSVRASFLRFADRYHRLGNFDQALARLKEELADSRADRLLETVRLARQVGGSDVTRILGNLGEYLRQETAVRSEIISRQSWVLNAARVAVSAPWVVLVFLSFRPETAAAYNSGAGFWVILIGFVFCLVAYRIIRLVGRLPEEVRSFR